MSTINDLPYGSIFSYMGCMYIRIPYIYIDSCCIPKANAFCIETNSANILFSDEEIVVIKENNMIGPTNIYNFPVGQEVVVEGKRGTVKVADNNQGQTVLTDGDVDWVVNRYAIATPVMEEYLPVKLEPPSMLMPELTEDDLIEDVVE